MRNVVTLKRIDLHQKGSEMAGNTDPNQANRWQLWQVGDHETEAPYYISHVIKEETTETHTDSNPDFSASPHFHQYQHYWQHYQPTNSYQPLPGPGIDFGVVNYSQPPKISRYKNWISILKSPAQRQQSKKSHIAAGIEQHPESTDGQWVIDSPDIPDIGPDRLGSANSDVEWPSMSSKKDNAQLYNRKCSKKKCEYCDEEFDNATLAGFHMSKMHTKFQQLICGICDTKCKSLASFRWHRKAHFVDQAYLCEVCGKMFLDQVRLLSHQLEQHQKESPYRCKICKKRFKTRRGIRSHKSEVHGPGLNCDFCASHYKSKKKMIIHLLNKHIDKKSYDCDICGAKFVYKYSRDSHVENNHTWACLICPKQFTMPKDAKAHCESEHTAEELKTVKPAYEKITKFRCDICFLCLATKQSLDKHKLKHKAKPFKTS